MLSRNGEDSREARNGVGPSWNTPGRQLAGASGVWGVLSSGINGDDRDLLPDAFADLSDRCGTEAQMNAALFVAQVDVPALEDNPRLRPGSGPSKTVPPDRPCEVCGRYRRPAYGHMAFKAGWHLALGLAGDKCVGVA